MLHGVIMSGGSGTRFWPLSRASRPKQFLTLQGDRSLLQSTRDRSQPLITDDRLWVVTNQIQAGETREQLDGIDAAHVLEEPCGRNTAPCIGLAAVALLESDPDAVMVVMPADHVIGPNEQFQAAIEQACEIVADDPDALVLFGVPPTSPATGFGYIERGEPLESVSGYQVASFKEKPNRDVAEHYLQSGGYYWNCGIFVWRAEAILSELDRYEPEMHRQLLELSLSYGKPEWPDRLAAGFPQLKSISIDHAVLERAEKVCVVEAPFDWDDVGSYEALARLNGEDTDGNTALGTHAGSETRNCVISSTDDHLIATTGVEDLIIVHTKDATLVAKRDDEAGLRKLVETLREQGHEDYL